MSMSPRTHVRIVTACALALLVVAALGVGDPQTPTTTPVAHAQAQVTEWQLDTILRFATGNQCTNQDQPTKVGYQGLSAYAGVDPDEGYEIDLYALYENGNPLEKEQHFATLEADGDLVYNTPPYSQYNQIENWDYTGGGTGLLDDGPQIMNPNCGVSGGQYYNDHRLRWGADTSYTYDGDTYTRTFMKARIDLSDSHFQTTLKPYLACVSDTHCGTDFGFFTSGGVLDWVNLDAAPYLGDSTIEFYRSYREE
jgi:hypothetical protein